MNVSRNLRSRFLLALPVAALAFPLAACSAPAAEEPAGDTRLSAEDVSAGFQKVLEAQGAGSALTKPVVDCLSQALVDSEVSDETLKLLAEGDPSAMEDPDDYALITKTVATAATTECKDAS